jgi:hypothetical protein
MATPYILMVPMSGGGVEKDACGHCGVERFYGTWTGDCYPEVGSIQLPRGKAAAFISDE